MEAWEEISLSAQPAYEGSIQDWAAENVDLPPSLTIRGKFDVSRSRHLIEPLNAMNSDHVREVNVLAPVRGGKSLLADVWLPYIVSNDAGPVIWNFQKDQTADDHCETRLWPLLLACKPVAQRLDLVARNQKRTSEIIFPHMFVIVQGPALSNLQSKGARYLINDEVWQYQTGRLEEAYSRVGDFVRMGIEKILNLSQGGEPHTDWHAKWESSTRHCWEVQCGKCGEYFQPRWSVKTKTGLRGMRWDEHRMADKNWDVNACLSSIRYECPHCAHPHMDTAQTKSEWNRTGRYVQTNTAARAERHGYWWPAVIDYPWAELVSQYLGAINRKHAGFYTPLIQFKQKRLAEFSDESEILQFDAGESMATYDVHAEWTVDHVKCFTVDRQKEDTYWGLVGAWSRTGEFRRIWFGYMTSGAAIEEKRAEHGVPSVLTMVDAGHEAKDEQGVYELCADYGWRAAKGSGYGHFTNARTMGGKRVMEHSVYKKGHPVFPRSNRSKKCFLYVFASSEMKDRVRRMQRDGKWKEPDEPQADGMDKEYIRQMSGEIKVTMEDKRRGRDFMDWKIVGPNHAFDCAAMQALLATILRILPNYEEGNA